MAKDLGAGFLRQRRNLLMISIALSDSDIAAVEVTTRPRVTGNRFVTRYATSTLAQRLRRTP